MSAGLAPACWENVPTVVTSPVIKGSLPPIEGDVDHVVIDGPDGGTADQVGVFLIDSF